MLPYGHCSVREICFPGNKFQVKNNVVFICIARTSSCKKLSSSRFLVEEETSFSFMLVTGVCPVAYTDLKLENL